jgi:hypothetical protein
MKYKSITGFLLTVVVVAGLWFVSKYKDIYTEEVFFKIVFINVPKQLVLETSATNFKIPAEVSASGFTLIWEKIFDQRIALDFNDNTYMRNDSLFFNPSKSIKNIKEDEGIAFNILNVDDLEIPLEYRRFMSKKVALVNNIKINYQMNYSPIKPPYFQIDSVTVTGNDKKVGELEQLVIDTGKTLNIKDTLTSIAIDLKQVDASLNYLPKKILLTVEAMQMTEGKVEVPVKLINTPVDQRVKLIPNSVQVIYTSAVANFNEITASDFNIAINYQDIRDSNVAVQPLADTKNDKIISYRITPAQVQVITIK